MRKARGNKVMAYLGMANYTLSSRDEFLIGRFKAMASPCEVLVDSTKKTVASRATRIASDEALRIEKTFSRYRDDNLVYRINNSTAKAIKVDEEMADLLDFANQCYDISDGLFDITSGILRRAWRFDGSQQLPTQEAIDALLPLVGWDKVTWSRPWLTLPEGMQIDFGGIGKEYAVDRAVTLVRRVIDAEFMINFGGDLHASGPPKSGKPWNVGVEHVNQTGKAVSFIKLWRGALTTSGDTHRYIEHEGIRYGHILHPRTGWPVKGAPSSVSVLSNSCTEAGILSTLAHLQGQDAEKFLENQNVKYWSQR